MARGVYSTSNYFLYSGALISAHPLTMACWVNPSATSAYQAYLSLCYTGGAGTDIDGWLIRSASSAGAVGAVTGIGSANSVSTAGNLTTGVWNHIAGVFSSVTSRIAYLNGVAGTENTTSRTPTAAPTKSVIGLFVTQANVKTIPVTLGNIAEVCLWNVALTQPEIAQLAAGYSPLFVRPESLIAYYPLIRGDASGDEPDYMAGAKMVEQGTVAIQTHPRVFYPGRPQFTRKTVAAGGLSIPVAMHHYRLMRG